MKKKLIAAAASITLVAAAHAQQAKPQPSPRPTPSVSFTGQELDDLFAHLNAPLLYQRAENGDFVRLIDPNVRYVMQKIVDKANEARRLADVAAEKATADAEIKAKIEKAKAEKVRADAEADAKAKQTAKP